MRLIEPKTDLFGNAIKTSSSRKPSLTDFLLLKHFIVVCRYKFKGKITLKNFIKTLLHNELEYLDKAILKFLLLEKQEQKQMVNQLLSYVEHENINNK
jgi:hypothetical protein